MACNPIGQASCLSATAVALAQKSRAPVTAAGFRNQSQGEVEGPHLGVCITQLPARTGAAAYDFCCGQAGVSCSMSGPGAAATDVLQ